MTKPTEHCKVPAAVYSDILLKAGTECENGTYRTPGRAVRRTAAALGDGDYDGDEVGPR